MVDEQLRRDLEDVCRAEVTSKKKAECRSVARAYMGSVEKDRLKVVEEELHGGK